jgi:hypothetical protein
MRKLLKNNSASFIKIRTIGLRLSPGQLYEINELEETDYINDTALSTQITEGNIQVGSWEDNFYTDPYEGLLWLKSQFDDNTYTLSGTTLTGFTPAIVTEPISGIKSTSLFLDILTMMKEFYNDPTNPVYEVGFQKFIGTGGREAEHLARTLNCEMLHVKTGWHEKEIKTALYKGPANLLVYYGYPNSFNSGTNGWSNEAVAKDMAKYDLIILGTGVETPTHPDYANTQIIIPRIKALNPSALIFGYVNGADVLATVQTNVDNWDTLGVHGIFFDQCGYDYGTTATNSRTAMNTKVDYVHGKTNAKLCFMNSWNIDHTIGTANDVSYPNSTWNDSTAASTLTYNDWYMLESFIVNTGAYSGDHMESASDWIYRGTKAIAHRATYGINIASVGIIENGHAGAQALFDFHYLASLMYSLEAVGSSDLYYAANSVTVPFYNRPDLSGLGRLWIESPAVVQDGTDTDIYWRYLQFGRLKLDFSTGALVTTITKDFV